MTSKKQYCFLIILGVLLWLLFPRTIVHAAASDYTADQAITWARGKVGQHVGYDDGSGYYQCVEFIQDYYKYLGMGTPYGNGCDYATNALPAGWTRTAGGIPQKGDILVYSAYSSTIQQYGHVAIYESDNSLYDQDGSVWQATVKNERAYYRTYTYNYWGCIHPNFKESTPSASFSPWSDSKYTYITETDASMGQKISASGGTLTQYGMVLYDSNGVELARAADSTSSWSNNPGTVFFKINAECHFSLAPGTTYKYKFYAIVSGNTFWSSMQSFKTNGSASISASFSPWNNSNYTYVTETDASIGQKISVSGGALTQYGMVLYDSNGAELARAADSTSSWSNNPGTVFFKINAECRYTLTPGTVYKYKFYAVISGVTKWSGIQSFTTNGTASITVSFSPWSNDNYTYISDHDAAIGQQIYVSGGVLSQYGMVLYDSDGTEIARAGDLTSNWSNDPGKIYFKINQECGYTLSSGTTYKYRFYAVVSGVTKWSGIQSFSTSGASPIVKPSISWTNSYSFPSKHSALLCIRATSSVSADYSEASIKIWDKNGSLVASKTENGSINTLTSLPIWYDVYSETGSLLESSSSYTYQYTTKANGYEFKSPVYSFTTENESQNHFGIDVSAHQGDINWAVASKYIDYAIIRCGYGSDYYSNDDGQWINNVSACEANGIPYGVYLYSYAENTQEAESEADHVLRLLAGHNPTLPVYLDLEDNNTVGKLSNSQILDQVKVFCNKIRSSGFSVGIYASKSWWDSKLTSTDYNAYDKWVAIYSGVYAESINNCNMWQYSSSGKVPGINTKIDLNYRRESVSLKPRCNHNSTIQKNNRAATCVEPGYTGDIYCANCGTFLGKGSTLAPLGHDFINSEQYCRRGCNTLNPYYKPSEMHTGNQSSMRGQQKTEVTSAQKQEHITISKTPASVKAKAKKNKVTVSWKKIKKNKKTKALLAQIQAIQVQFATDPAFEQIVVDRRIGKTKAKLSLKLQSKTAFFVRVRYLGSDGVSNWSAVKRVVTK